MREFAKAFYLSKEWWKAREYIFTRDGGLCVRCGKLGEIVHHRRHLTPENISEPEIALGAGNLELLCRDCHALAHAGDLPTDSALTFDKNGKIIKREFLSRTGKQSAARRRIRRSPQDIATAEETFVSRPYPLCPASRASRQNLPPAANTKSQQPTGGKYKRHGKERRRRLSAALTLPPP